ncbi:nicotinate-nucleotide adenylyltransferase [Alkaliphilus serpentinus]|uniref:nicotinate-nucleotide adenylyltransferase n=1 Tax=Alkaliphilus serpentinus TaxID=1482731 RepID=UPI001865797B|nr:nicotinate-nucleotide adenylyltransferase [Alkaliphilus serpentinus]
MLNNYVKRVGILGGTFDPLHLGHLYIAEATLEKLQLDKVIFIPTGISPHKVQRTPALHRYVMAHIATCENTKFQVSPIEINREGASFTIDTIRLLKDEYPKETTFYFITGGDAFIELDTWRNYMELLKLVTFVVVNRSEIKRDHLLKRIKDFKNSFDAKVILINLPTLEVSSTDIRQRVKDGQTIRYLVTEGVEAYIKKYRLYKD